MERPKRDISQSMECEEAKAASATGDKEIRVKRCYDYMLSLKSALSAEEFAQYLQYLKLLKANYVTEKIQFYATVAFQIFFPNDLRQNPGAFAERKELFLKSKSFYPRGPDRDKYSRECRDLLTQLEERLGLRTIPAQRQQQVDPRTKAEMTCMICMEPYEQYKDFYKAKCGHVACGSCWFTWLATCLECPMCKQRTRTKQLIKIQ